MKNLVEAVMQKKAEKIRRYPCNTNRASSIGYCVPELEGCLRRGVYERTAWQQKELHDVKLQAIFDEGHDQEAAILRDLAAAGIVIIEQQTPYEWKQYQITGHVDGKYIEDGIAYPIEVKSMSPHIFTIVNSWEDFKKKPWTRSYLAQITLYMLMQGIDKAIFILKNKSTGELKQLTVDLDMDLGEDCLKACEEINKHISENTLPDRIKDIDKCAECPFKTICLPDVSWGTPLQIKDDPEYEKKLMRYFELEASADEAKKLYETIRERAVASADEKGNLNIMVGKYTITGKRDAKGAFRIKIN